MNGQSNAYVKLFYKYTKFLLTNFLYSKLLKI
jgi:hypothetical protein